MKQHRTLASMLVACSCFLLIVPGAFAWQDNGIGVCTAALHQGNAITCPDGAGGSYIAWVHAVGGAEEIFLQRLNPNGEITWATNGINVSCHSSVEYNVKMVKASDDSVILAWTRGGGTAANISAQKVSGAGDLLWTISGMQVCSAPANQDKVCLCSDGSGGAIFAWQDLRGATQDIYMQRINATGIVQWTANGIPVCTATGVQVDPVMCSDGAGGAIVAWDDQRSSTDVYAQRVSASGTILWDTNGIPVSNVATSSQHDVQICGDGAGGAIMAWYDTRVDGNGDIYAQRVLSSGVAAWLVNGTPVCTNAEAQEDPVIAAGDAGGAFIGWIDHRNTPLLGVYVQRVDGAGAMEWSSGGIPACNNQLGCHSMRICSDEMEGAFITWVYDDKSTIIDVHAQRVSASGEMYWAANGTCVCCATGNQDEPAITCTSPGKAVIAWRDYRNAVDRDIYAQQLAISTPNDGLFEILLIVAIVGACGVVVLVLLYKKGKFPWQKGARAMSPSS